MPNAFGLDDAIQGLRVLQCTNGTEQPHSKLSLPISRELDDTIIGTLWLHRAAGAGSVLGLRIRYIELAIHPFEFVHLHFLVVL